MTITEFLIARLTEDQNAANAYFDQWTGAGTPAADLQSDFGTYLDVTVTQIGFGLGRMLAEWTMKKTILDDHDTYGPDGVHCRNCIPYPCRTLRALALPYRTHPDYDGDWDL